MKKQFEVLYAHDVTKMPAEAKRRNNLILTVSIISTLVLDILSFSIKGAQIALAANMKFIALMLIILYFVRHVVASSIRTFLDTQRDNFNSQSDSYITENINIIADTVRGKVFKREDEYSIIMSNSEVIFNLKEYINYIWTFLRSFPIAIADIVTAVIMAISILITEFIQTGDLKLTFRFTILLILCILTFSVIFKIRLHIRKKYRENHRILRKKQDILLNDVKNIEPLIKEEFQYRVNILVSNMKEKRELEKKENFKLNSLQILKTIVLAIFMIFIIIIKIVNTGGIQNFSLMILTDTLAVSTIYSNILDKVISILSNFENISNTLRDAEKVKPDIDDIMEVFARESSIKFSDTEVISKVTVEPFEFTYPGAMSVYKLNNSKPFVLERGKAYLVHGHTGCGKSTFMHLLIGKIRMDSSPISYGKNCEKAYLSSIMHESNGRIGSNTVLKEIIFNNDTSNLNRNRIIEILHGTHIYEDIMRNIGLTYEDDESVLNYLNGTTIEQYSSGQKQRLAIVKVLYNLNTSHQIVVFDEATNALDDTTALSVIKFMADYCQKDMKRIVMFVSHQVDLTREIANGSITFASKKFPVFDIMPEL